MCSLKLEHFLATFFSISPVDGGRMEPPAADCPLRQLLLGSTECFNSHTRRRVERGCVIFDCLICHYKSSNTSTMIRHIVTHAREKPYMCPYCPYRATQLAHMKSQKWWVVLSCFSDIHASTYIHIIIAPGNGCLPVLTVRTRLSRRLI